MTPIPTYSTAHPLQRTLASCAATALLLAGTPCLAQDEERGNFFNDPFVQLTDGLPACPAQKGPQITRAEVLTQTHYRAERGTSCYQAGRCRLPNSYLYDKEIIPRVQKAVQVDGGFGDTRVWAEGQRRWVWLKGCVRTAEQSQRMEQLVRGMDDVEIVINELVVLKP